MKWMGCNRKRPHSGLLLSCADLLNQIPVFTLRYSWFWKWWHWIPAVKKKIKTSANACLWKVQTSGHLSALHCSSQLLIWHCKTDQKDLPPGVNSCVKMFSILGIQWKTKIALRIYIKKWAWNCVQLQAMFRQGFELLIGDWLLFTERECFSSSYSVFCSELAAR